MHRAAGIECSINASYFKSKTVSIFIKENYTNTKMQKFNTAIVKVIEEVIVISSY